MPKAAASRLSPDSDRTHAASGPSDRRLRTVELALARSGIGYWEIDLEHDRAIHSDAWYDVAGWTPAAWATVAQPWRERCHQDDLERAQAVLQAHLDGKIAAIDIEYRLRTAQEGWRWLLNRGAISERDADGRPLRIVGTTIDIHARKQAENELRESEFRYRTVANFARGCVYEYTFDAAGQPVIQWANDGLIRVFGKEAMRIAAQGGGWFDCVHPDDIAAARGRLERQRAGESTVGESRIVDRSGEIRRLKVMARPFVDAHGQVQRVIAVAHDITDSIKMQEALEYSEFRYRTIAALTPGYAHEFRVNADGSNELVWASEGFVDVYGCDYQEFNRRGGWEAFCHPDDLGPSLAREQRWEAGTQTEGIARVVRLDGETRWLRCINRPLIDAAGRTTAIVGIGHDITNLMRTNEAVRASEQRFRLAVQAMAGLVYEADLVTGEVHRWPGLDALLGYREGEVPNTMQAWYELVHPEDRRRIQNATMPLPVDENDVSEFEYRVRNRDGDYEHLLDRALLVRDAANEPRKLIGCTTNVSERKRLERELLEISTREQQRIGNDLHDGLGQELTGIALLLRSLEQRLSREHAAAAPAVEQALTLVKGAIENARTLARGLSPANLERGGLEFALRDLVAQLRKSSGAPMSFRCRGGERLRLDEAVANHLYRIAQEGVSNALRHADATAIRVELEVAEKHVRLRIVDDGRGLGPKQPGNGMGLKIMQYRARMIGGELVLKKRHPRGIEVSCTCRQPAH